MTAHHSGTLLWSFAQRAVVRVVQLLSNSKKLYKFSKIRIEL